MQKGITVFIVGFLVITLAATGGVLAFKDNAQLAPLFSIGSGILIFLLAYVAHRSTGAIGNPFNGLQFGSIGGLLLSWIGGLLCSALVLGLALGLGFVQYDPEMNWFLALSAEQAKQSVEQMREASGIIEIFSLIGAFLAPALITPLMCLSLFPVYGWLGRRLLPKGLGYTYAVLAALGALGTVIAVFMPNPAFGEPNMAIAVPVALVYGAASTAALLWLFLVSNSVVVPSLAMASFVSMFQAGQIYYANPQQHMVPPYGVADLAVLSIVAIALWLYKVPDWKKREVAAVAFDGTSLTTAQIEEIEQRRSAAASAVPAQGQAEPLNVAAPPAGGADDDSTDDD